MRFKRPVAQNSHAKLQPTCEEIQAVIRVSAGIKTPSQIWSSNKRKAFLMVPSLLICMSSTFTALMLKLSFNILRVDKEILVIWSKSVADFFHNHS